MRYVVTPIPLPAATVSDRPSLPSWLQRAAEALQFDEDLLGSLAASRGIIKQQENICPSESLDFCCAYSEQLRPLLGSGVSAAEGDELSSWLISAPSGSILFTASSVPAELILSLYASAALASAVACQDYTFAPQLFAKAQACLQEAIQYSDMLASLGSPLPTGTADDTATVCMTSELLGAFISFISAQMMELSSTNFISHNTTWLLSDSSLQDNLRMLLNASKHYGDAAPIFVASGMDCFTELAELAALKPHILTVAGRMAAAKCLFAERKYSKCIEECREISSIIATCVPEEKGFVSISLCIECKDSLMEQLLELMAAAESSIDASDSLTGLEPAGTVHLDDAQVTADIHTANLGPHEPLIIDLAPIQEPASEFLADKADNSAEILLLNNIISQKDSELAEKQRLIDSLNAQVEELRGFARETSSVSALDFTSLLLAKDAEIHRLQSLVLECSTVSAPSSFPSPQDLLVPTVSVDEQLHKTVAELRCELDDMYVAFDDASKQLWEEKLATEYAYQTLAVLQDEVSDMYELTIANASLTSQVRALKDQAMVKEVVPQGHGTAVLTDIHVINDAERMIQQLQDRIVSLESQLLTAQKTLSDANETVAVYHQEIIEAEAETERLRDSLLNVDAVKCASQGPEQNTQLSPATVPLTDDLVMGFANAAIDIGGLKAGVSQAKVYDDMVELIIALEVENEKLKKKCLEYEISPPAIISLEAEPGPDGGDVEPGLSASLLQSIGTEIAIQSAWTRLPALTTHLQSIINRALEQITIVTTEYAQHADSQRDGSSIVNEYSHSDGGDSFEPSDNPDAEYQSTLHSRLFSIGTSSDNVDLLEKMLQEDASEPLTLVTVAKKLKLLGEGLQGLPTVVISGYGEDEAYNMLSERIIELVAEQHETNMNSMDDCYKDIEMAHINIADLRLCMRKTDKVMELYDRFSVTDQKRLYELQLVAQRKNAELVFLVRYMDLLVQAYQLSIAAIKQNVDAQGCTGKINGVEISTVLLEKDEQIAGLQEALKTARDHGEQRVSDISHDMRLVQDKYESLEKQFAEYKAFADGQLQPASADDDYFYNLLADRDRQIKELSDIVSLLNSGNSMKTVTEERPESSHRETQTAPGHVAIEPTVADHISTLKSEEDQEIHKIPDPQGISEAEHMTCVVESGIAEQPVYGVQCTPGIDYEQLLIAKNAEIKRLQVLCEGAAVHVSASAVSSNNLANTCGSNAFAYENATESVYARSSADLEEIQRLNTELNSSNSKVQELTESLEALKTKNIAANTAIDNQNNQIEELTQDKQKLQNLVIQLTEENLVKSATVQSVMTTSVASSTLATEINNLKLELSERDHEIVRLTHTIERLNKQIVDNAGNEVPQLSTIIEIPPSATNNEIIKNLVNSIKTQEASFTHIRTLLKEKQAEVLKLKEALERQEDIVRTLLSNPMANKMKTSDSADGNNALILTNYNDTSATDGQAGEEERARFEERIQKLEEELASKNYVIDSKSQEIDTLRGDLRRLQNEATELRAKIADLETQLTDAKKEIEQMQQRNDQASEDHSRRASRMMDDYTHKDLNEQIKSLYEILSAKDAEITSYKKRLGIEDDAAFTYL